MVDSNKVSAFTNVLILIRSAIDATLAIVAGDMIMCDYRAQENLGKGKTTYCIKLDTLNTCELINIVLKLLVNIFVMGNVIFMTTDRNPVGSYAPDFELPNIDNEVYHLGSCLEKFNAIAVVFLDCNSSEIDDFIDNLKSIQAKFKPQRFTFIAISSNDNQESLTDSVKTMRNFAEAQGLTFPYLRDTTQDVARSFGARVNPCVFLLDKQSLIRYAGKIDEESKDSKTATHKYLQDSIAALLAGKSIQPSYTEPSGTPIQWRSSKR